ncbi:hypothetical protein D3870_08815 [Noviherbaspirillum cavernae]|uniref:Uncharacterized protein n=1 Tax=Noviherbaspirillum cavernae TaxID=2320862 RepID=A0A418X123_9BURK|nr:DUF5335 domain-containing protein [Noviherbaspirillum cavernae]RJG06093.1 hypothetical protein D3870_08815 [Noviherbaspirillum cavernae]
MISKVEKTAWGPYFDKMSKALEGARAEIEVDSLQLGSQIEAEWVPLLGITYDPKSDIVELVMEGLDHMIHHPREVYVDHDAAGMTSLEVIDDEDVRQIVRLHDPLLLPSSDTRH